MKAMVLAAGLGTRLRPLTDHLPKALVEISGRTLLEITLTRLRDFGVREVIVNVHHFADLIVEYLRTKSNFGIRVEISREPVLLDTGGGLKKAAWFFLEDAKRLDEPFLLHNVDVISTVNFGAMLDWHNRNAVLATLAVQQRRTSRYLLFDDRLRLCGRRAAHDPQAEIVRPGANLNPLAFTGIHMISPRMLPMMSEEGAFSIINTYLRLAAQQQNISAFRADNFYWRDLGRLHQLQQAEEDYTRRLFS